MSAPDFNQICAYWDAVRTPGEIVELRYPATYVDKKTGETKKCKNTARCSSPEELAAAVTRLGPQLKYWVNVQRMKQDTPHSKYRALNDTNIEMYRWLFVDYDLKHSKDHPVEGSATDAEKEHVRTGARPLYKCLKEFGVSPAVGDSGNGMWFLVPIELPNTKPNVKLITGALAGLKARFYLSSADGSYAAKVDGTARNPSRVMGLPGTLNASVHATDERPDRMREILHKGSREALLTVAQLEEMASWAPVKADRPSPVSTGTSPDKGPFTFDIVKKLLEAIEKKTEKSENSFTFDRADPDPEPGPGWYVRCPHDKDHSDVGDDLNSSTVVWVNERGFAEFSCLHDGADNAPCNQMGWPEFISGWDAKGLQSDLIAPKVTISGGNSVETQKWLDEINAENVATENQAAAVPEVRGNTSNETKSISVTLPFFSDQALAEGFTRSHQGQIAYLDCGKWAMYQDGLWQRDEKELVASHRAGQFLMGSILPEVDKRIEEPKQAGSLKSRLCSANTQTNVVKLARQRPGIYHRLEEFDQDEFLIGAPGGKVIDLRTGKTRIATPADLIMKSVSVEPSSRPRPRWDKFINEITNGDHDLARYLQRWAGSCLTASPKDHTLFVAHGSGCNGKGTLVGIWQQILGPYSTTIPVDSLVTKKSGDTDLGGVAMLCGVRLAVAQEGETARRFNAGLIKTLTGGDRLTGKVLYENKFEFKPTHKLMILTNNKPRIDLDGGIRRRLHLVPFTRSFEAVKNVNLREELLEEAGSILQWMIDGCLAWQHEGLTPPSSVTDYTNEYFEEADDLKNWIEQNCIRDPHAWTANSDLFGDWKMFCQEARIFVGNQKDLVENLVREGFQKKRNTRGDKRGILGLRIRESRSIQ